jgi:hypothetical protein
MKEDVVSKAAAYEQKLIEKAVRDPVFRQKLIATPRLAVEQEIGISLPKLVDIKVVEQSTNVRYLVLPEPASNGKAGELSDAELETVAGGYLHQTGGDYDGCNYDE